MLLPFYKEGFIEAGCDEAGRGSLAGPVFAAAVILPNHFRSDLLNDSKKLTTKQRILLRKIIEQESLAWAIGVVTALEIDKTDILKASFLAMHRALDQLKTAPQTLLIDGNRFNAYNSIPHITIVKGDSKYMSIAAASIMAKTYRDEYMERIALEYPDYSWDSNKGYPTIAHRKAIKLHGVTPYHRLSFNLIGDTQLSLDL